MPHLFLYKEFSCPFFLISLSSSANLGTPSTSKHVEVLNPEAFIPKILMIKPNYNNFKKDLISCIILKYKPFCQLIKTNYISKINSISPNDLYSNC